jgi:hypothetical protein
MLLIAHKLPGIFGISMALWTYTTTCKVTLIVFIAILPSLTVHSLSDQNTNTEHRIYLGTSIQGHEAYCHKTGTPSLLCIKHCFSKVVNLILNILD